MKSASVIFLFFIFSIPLFSQVFNIRGRIFSTERERGLSYANLRVLNTMYGTAANSEGDYELKLTPGQYYLAASYIGFKSDTVLINLIDDAVINFYLEPASLVINEVTVLPGINPANAIIRKAIEAKHKRENLISDYTFSGFTKGLIKTTSDIAAGDNSVSLDVGGADTAKLKITGIIENESRGYFKVPDNYKEEIIARKQSSNIPSAINTLTGGRIIQNFYTDDIKFSGRELKSPIADDAAGFYFFNLEDSLAYDNRKVYRIYFEPEDKSDPGFTGRVFIASDDYNMVKIDVNLNDAANPGGIFTKVNVFQQYLPFNNVYMPIDYRLFVEANLLGLLKFGFEINSILYDYKINTNINNDFFDMALLTVQPDADKKDSVYWTSIQSIPNTLEEKTAYRRIDSLESVPKTFWDRFSFLSVRTELSDNFSVSGPLGIYHFNRVEGNSLDFGLFADNLAEKRFSAQTTLVYGFADKKFKWGFTSEYLLGKFRTHSVNVSAYDKLNVLFSDSDEYSSLLPTLTSLFDKYDFKNYFYESGFNVKLVSEVLPVLKLGIGYEYREQQTASVNSNFSFFSRNKEYEPNRPIYNNVIGAITGSFSFDFRKYIEDGYFRRRTSEGKSFFLFSGSVYISDEKYMNNDMSLTIYKLNLYTSINSFGSTSARINLVGNWSTGAVPYQMMTALAGNIQSLGKDNTFRTVDYSEVYGDNVITLGFNYNFGDELFTILDLPIIEDMQLLLGAHLNAGWTSISAESKMLNAGVIPEKPIEYTKPLVEIGFSLGQMLMPLRMEFTWKLNHFGKNNFVVGVNSAAF
ncbi:MAG: carboxypeptidase-like regulatory domain-containing protein [Melioribacteraceae bacterium]|nr:carboxypeptidase-like regulatory domain-containing protein [Melioribacteraceae bacterium]